MFCPNPSFNLGAQPFGQIGHFFCFLVGNRATHLVTRSVPLFPKCIQASDQLWISFDREFERLKNAVVVRVTAGAIACGSKSGGGSLQCRIVGNSEAPIRA